MTGRTKAPSNQLWPGFHLADKETEAKTVFLFKGTQIQKQIPQKPMQFTLPTQSARGGIPFTLPPQSPIHSPT